MFFKRATKLLNGVPYTYILLTEGYREGGKVKHRTLANLGRLSLPELEGLTAGLQRLTAHLLACADGSHAYEAHRAGRPSRRARATPRKRLSSRPPKGARPAKPSPAVPDREESAMPDRKHKGAFELNLGFGNILKGIGNLFDLLSEVTETEEGEVTRSKKGGGEGKWKDAQGVYGFSIRVGAGGKARVEPFGNIRDTQRGPVVEEVREPMADVFDEGDTIQVICELPGVEAEEIQVKAQGDIVEISAEGKRRKYRKEILLGARVTLESLVTSYKNGILEISVRKDIEKERT